MLASGSQDGTIRLWTITSHLRSSQASVNMDLKDLMDDLEASAEGTVEEDGRQISLKSHIFYVKTEDEK